MPSDFLTRPISRCAILLVALLAAGCNRSVPEKSGEIITPAQAVVADTGKKPAPGYLLGTDSAPDIRALLDTAETRLRRGDTVGLVRLMVDDSAYRRHIFPTSSAFDTSSEEAFRFVLSMHKANSAKGLRRVLTDARKPDSPPPVFLRGLDSVPVPGGMIYHVLSGEGLRPFGTALRIGASCRIATFAQPGSTRRPGPSGR